jgi:hypothetical protein
MENKANDKRTMYQGHEFHAQLISSEPCWGNLLFVNPRLSALPMRLPIFEQHLIHKLNGDIR